MGILELFINLIWKKSSRLEGKMISNNLYQTISIVVVILVLQPVKPLCGLN